MKSTVLAFSLLCASVSLLNAQSRAVYQSDFAQGVNGGTLAPGVTMNWSASNLAPNWSNPVQTTTAPQDGRVFLGQFGKQNVTLSLQGLPTHDSITVSFDFYAIDTWDGNRDPTQPSLKPPVGLFGFDVDGSDTLLYATFANNLNYGEFQTYPSEYPRNGNNPATNLPTTGAFSINQLGFPNPEGPGLQANQMEDAEYRFTYTFANSNSSLQLSYFGQLVDFNPTLVNESWGIDSIRVTTLSSGPVISYLIPDIGTPDMNTYMEIIGPYNANGNFWIDGVYLNNPGDALQVQCANPADTQYVRFGPCVVSWDGRMISTQVFVLPGANPASTDWQQGIKIPIQVKANAVLSNVDTFYIVQPQTLGVNGTLSTPGVLGSGGAYGTRSRRGAMIVDSLKLNGSGTYTVSTQDCDPGTPGNQGYLPFVLLSRGPIVSSANSTISVSAPGADGGPGGGGSDAGPGGGGGGGSYDESAPPNYSGSGGDGYTGGETPYIGGGNGSGAPHQVDTGGSSLNGVLGASSTTVAGGIQGTGGGTGFCFGMSGSGGDDTVGGYGGGSGAQEDGSNGPTAFGGGGGGFASQGGAILNGTTKVRWPRDGLW